MSFYKPTFLSPSFEGIDATIDNIFTWQTSGTEPQVAYQLFLYKNSDNTLVYDSTKLLSNSTFHTIPALSLQNSEKYKWKVVVYKDDINYMSSNYEFIQTNNTPILSIDTFPIPLDNPNYFFTATYTQTQNVPIKNFRWIIYDINEKILVDSGLIYNSTIEYQSTGLISGITYKIEVQITNQNDVFTTSGKTQFLCSFTYPALPSAFEIVPDNELGIMKIKNIKAKQILGMINGGYSYLEVPTRQKFGYELLLDKNATVEFDEQIPDEFTLTYWVKLPVGFNGNILSLDDDFVLSYNSTKQRFYLKNKYRYSRGNIVKLPTGYFVIGVLNNKVYIMTSSYGEIIM